MSPNILSDNELDAVSGGAGRSGVIASGSFGSNTGTQLNILVNWSVRTDNYGHRALYVDVNASSYALYTIGGGVELNVNGMNFWANSAAINYGGRTPAINHLASFTVANVVGAANVSAVWHYNGVYSGVSIGDIRASSVINV